MKVVALVGSPRKGGNTDILLQKALEGAKDQGAQTQIFYLNDLHIRGCQACYTCKKTGECAVEDDLTQVYQALNEADGVILGSPIYFGRFTAQTALFMDRLYAYLRPDFTSSFPKGKKLALVFTQNQADPSLFAGTVHSTAQVLKRIGFADEPRILVGSQLGEVGAALKNEKYLESAFSIGQQLASVS